MSAKDLCEHQHTQIAHHKEEGPGKEYFYEGAQICLGYIFYVEQQNKIIEIVVRTKE